MNAEYKKIAVYLKAPSTDDTGIPCVYFLGVGGIGMSALARYFNSLGVQVSGYDKTETLLTRQLSAEGISIHYEDDVALLEPHAQFVVYTPAVPEGHAELNFYRSNNYVVVKRSDVLGAITNSTFNICVAGTHGKTTTSAMVAHILRHCGFGCTAFLGGVSVNYNSNFWSSQNNVCVAEADEYDRSFLKLSPDIAIISSMDADHLDIYGTAENMEQAFIDFSIRLKQDGLLISRHGLKRSKDLQATHRITYDLTDSHAGAYTTNISAMNGSYRFDVLVETGQNNTWQLKDILLHMGGRHNIENALAAIIVAHHLHIANEKIIAAMADFKGVKRRFEYILKNDSMVFIDDYAHHPQELTALITGARELFDNWKCTVIFQPHLFSRTRDFASGFAAALGLADDVILLPIYPARELPVEGVSSNMIGELMKITNKKVLSKAEALLYVKNNKPALLITAGAGDIDTLVAPLKEIMETVVADERKQ